jgi:hypothetical protein
MFSNTIRLNDEALKKTYSYIPPEGMAFKTNLLGLDEGCDKKYKIVPIEISNLTVQSIKLSDIQQGLLGNCVYLSALRSIVRRYPQVISEFLTEVDSKHMAVHIFAEEAATERTTFIVEKTIVVPDTYFYSLVKTMHNFFSSASTSYENNWVRLIEKVLVLNFMSKNKYPIRLMNIQIHGHNFPQINHQGVVPSYEDVLPGLNGFSELLGCKTERKFFFNPDDSRNIIKEKFIDGELITISFLYDNEHGLETQHQYDLINFAYDGNKEYVLLSNPWGNNYKKSIFDYKKIDILSLEMLIPCSNKEIVQDKGLIILPRDVFDTIALKCNITCGAHALCSPKEDDVVKQMHTPG